MRAASRSSAFVVARGACVAGDGGHARALDGALGGGLGAHQADRFRRRADEDDARRRAGLGELGVLGEEAVAGVDGLGAASGARPR